jgi:general stress protein YciG
MATNQGDARIDGRSESGTQQRSDGGKGNSQRADGHGSSQGSGQKSTSKRGFAAMDEATQRMIASKGGQAAHQKGTAHEFDSEEARRAGQKGGEAVSRDREHMAEIGRKGGESRQSANRLARQGSKEEKR